MKHKAYYFTEEDINLITFALRRLSKGTSFKDLKEDSLKLIKYIEDDNNPLAPPKEPHLR